mmetsp:Transcript_124445/g.265220  ORF Transcript_124445/g.265220 Transcript_124445/m.265220 type:complete len:203 (-) Transcript_124445:5-613(-)
MEVWHCHLGRHDLWHPDTCAGSSQNRCCNYVDANNQCHCHGDGHSHNHHHGHHHSLPSSSTLGWHLGCRRRRQCGALGSGLRRCSISLGHRVCWVLGGSSPLPVAEERRGLTVAQLGASTSAKGITLTKAAAVDSTGDPAGLGHMERLRKRPLGAAEVAWPPQRAQGQCWRCRMREGILLGRARILSVFIQGRQCGSLMPSD